MNEVEQQAADTVISRMEFLERITEAAQGHWNVIEYKVPQDSTDAINIHNKLGELLKQNREADSSEPMWPEGAAPCTKCSEPAVIKMDGLLHCLSCGDTADSRQDHSWVNQDICCRTHATDFKKWTTMIVCPDCGDKRCPRAENCDNFCTADEKGGT